MIVLFLWQYNRMRKLLWQDTPTTVRMVTRGCAWPRHALVVGTVLVVVGGLMVSRLPTFSFKKGRVPRHLVLPSLLAVALLLGVIASSPWIGLSLLGLGYASLIPFSWFTYRRQETQDRQASAPAGDVVTLHAVDSGSPPRD